MVGEMYEDREEEQEGGEAFEGIEATAAKH